MAATTKSKGFWNFVNDFEGDKVTWMITLILIMISILAISSSTPMLAMMEKSSRSEIIKEQFGIASFGTAIIIGLYNIRKIGFFRILSQLGFALSLVLLSILFLHIDTPLFKAVSINTTRSEERRVGKECRSRWSPYH